MSAAEQIDTQMIPTTSFGTIELRCPRLGTVDEMFGWGASYDTLACRVVVEVVDLAPLVDGTGGEPIPVNRVDVDGWIAPHDFNDLPILPDRLHEQAYAEAVLIVAQALRPM